MSNAETAQTGAEVAPVVDAEAPVEQAPAPEPTTEQVDGTPVAEKPRDEKGRFVPQERLNEVTRARREAERNWQAAETRARDLEQQLAQYRQPSQTQGNEAPTLEAYNNDLGAWQRAMTEHVSRQVISQIESRQSEQEQQRTLKQVAEQFDVRSREYAAANPGFDDRLADLSQSVQFDQYVIEAIGISEHGPAIADYLAQHLDEADRVARLPPHLATLQLGRIEAKVSAPKPKPVTNAPPPAPVLGGGSTVQKDPERMSTDEWLAWRRAQLSAK